MAHNITEQIKMLTLCQHGKTGEHGEESLGAEYVCSQQRIRKPWDTCGSMLVQMVA